MEVLALTLPSITINSSDLEEVERFDETVVQLMTLPKLELLRIYNWPIYDEDFVLDDFERDHPRYLSALDEFMANIFHRMKARGVQNFPFVCFGAETWSRVQDSHLSYIFPVVGYTHTDRRSVYGELLSKAVRWTKDQLEEAQSDCGRLDFMA